jgi:alpha-glucosidase
VQTALDSFASVGAPVSWVLGNHDKDRQVSRFGGGPVGLARARAAALLMLSLPGSPYLYAGDELGLPQAVVPDEAKLDPIFWRSGGERAGRDGCRVPMPWNAETGVGFSPDGAAEPWLPIPADWNRYAVSDQARDGGSMLTLYRRALALRAAHPALGSGDATVTTHGDVLTVRCTGGGETVRCVLNMGSATVLVRSSGTVLLASTTRVRSSAGSIALPPNSAVWVTED